MEKKKIVFLCHLSTVEAREHLHLRPLKLRNCIASLLHHPLFSYSDYAIWNADFIEEMEKYPEYEFHIVSPHSGMKKRIQEYSLRGIHYHWFKDDGNLLTDFIKAKLKWNQKTDYRRNRKIISSCISNINPKIIVLCGAECTSFSIAAIDVKNVPLYVLLQTVANQQSLINRGIGSEYTRNIERQIFLKTSYFGTCEEDINLYLAFKNINPNAKCLSISFPSHQPSMFDVEKQFDFSFFGRVVINKGIEDVLKAFAIVAKKHPQATLNVIGPCDSQYLAKLKSICHNNIADKVIFSGGFPNMDDVHRQVQKSRIVVVPGITAALNCTVRESMLMGRPTIVYETSATPAINKDKQCLFVAKMQDVEDLAEKMLDAYEHSEKAKQIAANGKQYADEVFGNKKVGEKLIANIAAVIDNYYAGVPIPEDLLLNK